MKLENRLLDVSRLFTRRKLLKGLAGGTAGAMLVGPLANVAAMQPLEQVSSEIQSNEVDLGNDVNLLQAESGFHKHSPLGGWQITVTFLTSNFPPDQGLQMFAAGGGYVESNGLRVQAGMGSWKSTSKTTFAYYFYGYYFDQNGALTRFNEVLHPNAKLSDDGLSYESEGFANIHNPDGSLIRTAKVLLKGKRIVVPRELNK